jgi:hypothetical protein
MLPAPSEDGLTNLAWYHRVLLVSKLVLHGTISIDDTLFLFLSADNGETQGKGVRYNW